MLLSTLTNTIMNRYIDSNTTIQLFISTHNATHKDSTHGVFSNVNNYPILTLPSTLYKYCTNDIEVRLWNMQSIYHRYTTYKGSA